MDETSTGGFALADKIIFILCIVVTYSIALYTAFKNKATTKDFYTANRTMGIFTVALSTLSGYISTNFITTTVAEIYGYGMEVIMSFVGSILGMILCTYSNLIVFYDLELNTVYEYFELRYGSKALRICTMLSMFAGRCIAMGLTVYPAALVITTVTPLDLMSSIVIMGISCGLYATIGGTRGVILTDSFMMVVMFCGIIAISIIGLSNIGAGDLWTIAEEGGRTTIANFDPNLYQRQNVYSLLLGGFFGTGKLYATTQVALQRVYSAKSFRAYEKSLVIIVLFYFLIKALLVITSLVAYASYAGCDPLKEGKIRKIDQILPYLVNDKMIYIRGISGIFNAALICASASTLSTMMNSLSNLLYCDILCKLESFQKLPERTSLIICRSMTMSMVIPTILFAYIASHSISVLAVSITLVGTVNGPLIGIFFLALFFPMSNVRGAFVGFFTSIVVLLWMVIGKFLTPSENDDLLPMSTDFCHLQENNETQWGLSRVTRSSLHPQMSDDNDMNNLSSNMYDVVYHFNYVFGTLICVVVGLLASYALGSCKIEDVPPEYISPLVRWIYYKEKLCDAEASKTKKVDLIINTKL